MPDCSTLRHPSRSYGNWVVAGGTTRHLLTSMQPNSASLLLLDEASMMAGPQYLALITLLRAHAPLLTAGDHRQLGVISQHDFAADRRPAVVRFRAYLSAYDYTRLLCRAPGSSAVSCALSYTHRLPATLRELLAPEYAQDGITLRGRPPKALLPLSSAAGGSPWEALWVQGGGPGGPGEATEGVFLVVYDEAASGRTNALELELVRLIMEASPWHAKQQQQQRQAGGGGGGGSVALITPHRAQRRQLQRLVRAWGWAPAGCRVDTVDKMQVGWEQGRAGREGLGRARWASPQLHRQASLCKQGRRVHVYAPACQSLGVGHALSPLWAS